MDGTTPLLTVCSCRHLVSHVDLKQVSSTLQSLTLRAHTNPDSVTQHMRIQRVDITPRVEREANLRQLFLEKFTTVLMQIPDRHPAGLSAEFDERLLRVEDSKVKVALGRGKLTRGRICTCCGKENNWCVREGEDDRAY